LSSSEFNSINMSQTFAAAYASFLVPVFDGLRINLWIVSLVLSKAVYR
jgi:hypothetical protein